MSLLIGKKSFNKVWAASISKAEFVKHYSEVKEFKDVDLEAEYDKLVPKEEKSKDKK